MKQFFYTLLIAVVLSCGATQAQNYKMHEVRPGETIEDICKAYKVSPYDVYSLNPDAKNGLAPNMKLIIPNSKVSSVNGTQVQELTGYKTHRVKRKETLYSISKKYNITVDDIKKHNKQLYAKNLRKGDKIKIPQYRTKTVVPLDPTKPVETPAPVSTTPTDLSQVKSYVVRPKEGKWRIAYKFGITVDELEALNPEMNAVLKVGEIIKVPNISETEERTVDDTFDYYTVLPKEGFFRLRKKLGVTQQELEALNPGLAESGLKAGMVLKVPTSAATSNTAVDASSGNTQVDLSNQMLDTETKHIALMLPFKLNRLKLDQTDEVKDLLIDDPLLAAATDFHSGALMALDSLKRLGISVRVDVYDTQNAVSHASSLARNGNLKTVDAVIGPLMTGPFNQVASDLRSDNIPVVAPISKSVKLGKNVFQSRPDNDFLTTTIVNHLKRDSSAINYVIISDAKRKGVSAKLKQQFPSATQLFSRKDSKTGKDEYYVLTDDVLNALKPGQNIVFLETKKAGFVSNISSTLNALITDEMKIQLVTTDFNKAFESDEVSNYHLSNLQLLFPSVRKAYKGGLNFAKAYKKKYGVTPSKMAVRGFDVTMDVVLRLATAESLYDSVKDDEVTEYIENKFAYQKKSFGGYYNNSAYIIKYNDLNLVEVK